MFERYTEKARRVIFFARYEASQFGNPRIETEHLLLGLLREDRSLANRFMNSGRSIGEIRDDIERHTKRGERISTSVEMPLSDECTKILKMAGDEADSLEHRYIDTEHLLIAILWEEQSLASRLLRERGLKPDTIRAELAKRSTSVSDEAPAAFQGSARTSQEAVTTLNSFLAGTKWYNWEQLSPFFTEGTHFIDATGKHWKGRQEIEKQFEVLFAPYAKRNVTFLVENADAASGSLVAASVLWENVSMPGEAARAMHRMTVILVPEAQDWKILLIQVTPILTR